MSAFDFSFAWEGASGPSGPWSHLQVVRFEGREEMSALDRYEIILLASAWRTVRGAAPRAPAQG